VVGIARARESEQQKWERAATWQQANHKEMPVIVQC